MATAKKRSLSDTRHLNPPTSHNHKTNDDGYCRVVLELEESEEEVDQRLLREALELGIHISQDPRPTLEVLTHDISTLDLDSSASGSPEVANHSPFRASQSIDTPSQSSIDSHRHRKTPSLAATSITSTPSTTSVSSHKSNYLKFKNGFRRISNIKRRKALTTPSPPELPVRPSTAHHLRPELQPRSTTTTTTTIDPTAALSSSKPYAITTEPLPIHRSFARRKIVSMPQAGPPLPSPSQPTLGPPPPPSPSPVPPPSPPQHLFALQPPAPTHPAAVDRSLLDSSLKKLRTRQLQEQLRFISFRASQARFLSSKHAQSKRDSLAIYRRAQEGMEMRHAEAIAKLEQQHLAAEVDLMKALEIEAQACDVTLKHMQAYCNPREHIEGMPKREITKADYKKLEQQYHIKNGMANLHTSRVNVLREKQAKQLERILGKQEQEMEKLAADFEAENLDLDRQLAAQEGNMQQEFAERKQRLVWRWQTVEAVERRKLEKDTGEEYGALPTIEWGDPSDDPAAEEQEAQRIIATRGINLDPDTGLMVMEGGSETKAGAGDVDVYAMRSIR
ncbi:MAG: hypothetical protein Q9163_001802 [Psora crenata]